MRTWPFLGLRTLGLSALVGLSALGSAAVKIEAAPLFEGKFGTGYMPPVKIRLFNDGRPIRGVVQIDDGNYFMPIDLPTGVTKEIIASRGTNPSYVKATLSAPGISVRSKEVVLNQTSSNRTILGVGGNAGDLDFLVSSAGETKKQNDGNSSFLAVCYVTPEDMPTRFSHLMGLSAIVLGEGTERLTEQNLSAIRTWVKLGGNLVVLGGPSRAALDLPGIREILPVAVGDPTNLRLSNDEMVTVRQGRPFLGAREVFNTEGINAFARPYGLGSVVYANANVTEPVFQTWAGRRSLYQALRISRFERVNNFLIRSQGFGDYNESYAGAYSSPGMSWSSSGMDPFGGSAFSVSLPPTSQVATLFLAYLIIVLPVNFLVLRKLKKLEWAWFTCPVISAGFAFAFVQQGSNLYKAESSNWTQGILVSAPTGEGLAFSGYTQAFFQVAGVQSLKLRDIDWMTTSGDYRMGMSSAEPLVDVGTIVADNISTRPLEFKQFDYRADLSGEKGASVETVALTPSQAVYRITNRTDQVLSNSFFVALGQVIPITQLNPGQSITQTIKRRTLTQKERDSWYRSNDPIYASLAPTSSEDRSAFFVGTVTNFNPPLEAGKNLPTTVRLVVSADLGKEFAAREIWR